MVVLFMPSTRKNCPICAKASVSNDFLPFCSQRCQTLDLGKWLNASYSVPTSEEPQDALPEGEE